MNGLLTRSRSRRVRPLGPCWWAAVWAALAATGCSTLTERPADPLTPSNYRHWKASLTLLPKAEFQGDRVTLRNIRSCRYLSEEDYVVRHYDDQFSLSDVESVDFVVVPFQQLPSLAHTMLSFGFADGRYLGVSVEARLEEHEEYSPLAGAMRQFELMYVVADERDLVTLRTEHRDAEVYIYRTRVRPAEAREMFIDVLHRVNKLADEPEFYDTVRNNCTTNIVKHFNRLRPGRIPLDWRVLLPGHSDRLVYDVGLIDNHLPFEQVKQRALVNTKAHRFRDARDFSAAIRR